jgi:hypothetical protein
VQHAVGADRHHPWDREIGGGEDLDREARRQVEDGIFGQQVFEMIRYDQGDGLEAEVVLGHQLESAGWVDILGCGRQARETEQECGADENPGTHIFILL